MFELAFYKLKLIKYAKINSYFFFTNPLRKYMLEESTTNYLLVEVNCNIDLKFQYFQENKRFWKYFVLHYNILQSNFHFQLNSKLESPFFGILKKLKYETNLLKNHYLIKNRGKQQIRS